MSIDNAIRIERLNSASLRRVIEPDEEVTGTLTKDQILPDELLSVADLNLHVAVMLRDLQLPAALARHVLTAAVQDFVDNVKPTDALIVGMYQQFGDQVGEDAALVRELCGGAR